jgi:hypothetical protein
MARHLQVLRRSCATVPDDEHGPLELSQRTAELPSEAMVELEESVDLTALGRVSRFVGM